jgi:peroxiredoxin
LAYLTNLLIFEKKISKGRSGGEVLMNKRSIKILVLLLLVGLFVYFGVALANRGKFVDVGDKAYDFQMEDLKGKTIKLSDYKGQVVAVNYFATWCKPCVDEAPDLEAFEKEYGDTYKLLIIDRGETRDRVNKFVKKNKTTSTYLMDFDNKVSKAYNVVAQPETFIVDKQGVIREHYIGPISTEDLYGLVSKYE